MFRRRFLRKPSTRKILALASIITCAIFIISGRVGEMETAGLHNPKISADAASERVRRYGVEPVEQADVWPWNSGDDSTGNRLAAIGRSNYELKQEVRELRRKIQIYERLNALTELDSYRVSVHGSKTRQNVFLFSDVRAGSSFLGELFNQHPEVFYLYEPVTALDYYRENRHERVYDSMVTHMLGAIFRCHFAELSYLTDFLSYQYSSLKHRLSSRVLSSPPLCPESFSPSNSIRTCTPLKTETVSAICRLQKHTVVKSIQMRHIHKLSYLMDSEGPADYSLKVIHLVRDPRAILNSCIMRNSRQNWTVAALTKYARELCGATLRNIKYAVSAPPWLQGHYTLLRYEDLATSPHQIAEQLYKFVGINISPRVRVWIDRVTREGWGSVSASDPASRSYSAQNLTDSVKTWRLQMPYSLVRVVETECYEVMNLLGYTVVEDEEELRTVSLPLRV